MKKLFQEILEKVSQIGAQISEAEFQDFINVIKAAPRIYVFGYGRSGLMVKAFAMRLVHLRRKVFVIGETVTPGLRKNDVLLAVSGSGETTQVVETAKTAKKLGGKVVVVTANPDSQLAKVADTLVIIPTQREEDQIKDYEIRKLIGAPITITPLGSLFEVSALIFFEACVIELMNQLGIEEEDMQRVHANI